VQSTVVLSLISAVVSGLPFDVCDDTTTGSFWVGVLVLVLAIGQGGRGGSVMGGASDAGSGRSNTTAWAAIF